MIKPLIKTLNVKALKCLMDEQPDLCLIDVRELDEWNQAHIPGAVHIPKDFITSRIQSVAPDKLQPVYLHCKSGMRSMYAAQCLVDLGYEEVYSVEGGILDWEKHKYPIKS